MPTQYLSQDLASQFVLLILKHLADQPIKTAEMFRNTILGDGALAINPMLGIEQDQDVRYIQDSLIRTVAEGRMVDFGFIPNELIKQESIRSRSIFERGEFQHPYETWLGVSQWEGGMCGYYFTPHPMRHGEILCIELYGVDIKEVGKKAVLIYDIVSIEVRGEGDTVVKPVPMVGGFSGYDEPFNISRGANSLDPLVTMLRLMADASIPIIDVEAPVRLNKIREKKGKFPIPDHTKVWAKDYVSAFLAARAGGHAEKGTHASPIAHWRRAHTRTLASGRMIAVRSSKVNWRDSDELHRIFYKVKT